MPPERLIPPDNKALAPPSASADVWAVALTIAQVRAMRGHNIPIQFMAADVDTRATIRALDTIQVPPHAHKWRDSEY
jgi:hypothetical protein